MGFTGYYAEKFEGTEGVGDALKRTWDVCNEGWGQMDDATGLTSAKQKVKDFSKKVDNYVNDGDDTKLSFGEKAWETVKAVGDVADSVVSAKGVSLGCLAAGGGIATATAAKGGLIAASSSLATAGHTTAAAIVGTAPAVVVDTAVVGGAGTALYGAGEVVLADKKEEVQSGVNKVVAGASIASAGMAMAPGSVEIAAAAGIPVKAGSSALANCLSIPKAAQNATKLTIRGNALVYAKTPGVTFENGELITVKKLSTQDELVTSQTDYAFEGPNLRHYDKNGRLLYEKLLYEDNSTSTYLKVYDPKTGKLRSEIDYYTQKGKNIVEHRTDYVPDAQTGRTKIFEDGKLRYIKDDATGRFTLIKGTNKGAEYVKRYDVESGKLSSVDTSKMEGNYSSNIHAEYNPENKITLLEWNDSNGNMQTFSSFNKEGCPAKVKSCIQGVQTEGDLSKFDMMKFSLIRKDLQSILDTGRMFY